MLKRNRNGMAVNPCGSTPQIEHIGSLKRLDFTGNLMHITNKNSFIWHEPMNQISKLIAISSVDVSLSKIFRYNKAILTALDRAIKSENFKQWVILKCEACNIPPLSLMDVVQIYSVISYEDLKHLIFESSCFPLPLAVKLEHGAVKYFFTDFTSIHNKKVNKLCARILDYPEKFETGIKLPMIFNPRYSQFIFYIDKSLEKLLAYISVNFAKFLYYNHIAWGFFQGWLRKMVQLKVGVRGEKNSIILQLAEKKNIDEVRRTLQENFYVICEVSNYFIYVTIGYAEQNLKYFVVENVENDAVSTTGVVQYYRHFIHLHETMPNEEFEEVLFYSARGGSIKITLPELQNGNSEEKEHFTFSDWVTVTEKKSETENKKTSEPNQDSSIKDMICSGTISHQDIKDAVLPFVEQTLLNCFSKFDAVDSLKNTSEKLDSAENLAKHFNEALSACSVQTTFDNFVEELYRNLRRRLHASSAREAMKLFVLEHLSAKYSGSLLKRTEENGLSNGVESGNTNNMKRTIATEMDSPARKKLKSTKDETKVTNEDQTLEIDIKPVVCDDAAFIIKPCYVRIDREEVTKHLAGRRMNEKDLRRYRRYLKKNRRKYRRKILHLQSILDECRFSENMKVSLVQLEHLVDAENFERLKKGSEVLNLSEIAEKEEKYNRSLRKVSVKQGSHVDKDEMINETEKVIPMETRREGLASVDNTYTITNQEKFEDNIPLISMKITRTNTHEKEVKAGLPGKPANELLVNDPENLQFKKVKINTPFRKVIPQPPANDLTLTESIPVENNIEKDEKATQQPPTLFQLKMTPKQVILSPIEQSLLNTPKKDQVLTQQPTPPVQTISAELKGTPTRRESKKNSGNSNINNNNNNTVAYNQLTAKKTVSTPVSVAIAKNNKPDALNFCATSGNLRKDVEAPVQLQAIQLPPKAAPALAPKTVAASIPVQKIVEAAAPVPKTVPAPASKTFAAPAPVARPVKTAALLPKTVPAPAPKTVAALVPVPKTIEVAAPLPKTVPAPAPKTVAATVPIPKTIEAAAPVPKTVVAPAPLSRPVKTAAPVSKTVSAPTPKIVAASVPVSKNVEAAAPVLRPVKTAVRGPKTAPAQAPKTVEAAAPVPKTVAAPLSRPVKTAAPVPKTVSSPAPNTAAAPAEVPKTVSAPASLPRRISSHQAETFRQAWEFSKIDINELPPPKAALAVDPAPKTAAAPAGGPKKKNLREAQTLNNEVGKDKDTPTQQPKRKSFHPPQMKACSDTPLLNKSSKKRPKVPKKIPPPQIAEVQKQLSNNLVPEQPNTSKNNHKASLDTVETLQKTKPEMPEKRETRDKPVSPSTVPVRENLQDTKSKEVSVEGKSVLEENNASVDLAANKDILSEKEVTNQVQDATLHCSIDVSPSVILDLEQETGNATVERPDKIKKKRHPKEAPEVVVNVKQMKASSKEKPLKKQSGSTKSKEALPAETAPVAGKEIPFTRQPTPTKPTKPGKPSNNVKISESSKENTSANDRESKGDKIREILQILESPAKGGNDEIEIIEVKQNKTSLAQTETSEIEIIDTARVIGSGVKCPHCMRVYSDVKTVQAHERIAHIDSMKLFHCDKCPKTFFKPHFLELHIKRKHDRDTFCKFCEVFLPDDTALGRHLETEKHTQIKRSFELGLS